MAKIKLVLIGFILLNANLYSQENNKVNSKEKNKVVFIYGFTKYFIWPTEMKNGDFKIAVKGASPEFLAELNKIVLAKTVDGQKISILNLDNQEAGKPLPESHMLFYNALVVKDFKLKDISKNTLVISDNQSDYTNAMLTFIEDEAKKLKFVYNQKNTSKSNLEVKGDFKKLAVQIIE